MAVNKKGMRKVNFNGRQYFWNIQEQTSQRLDENGNEKTVEDRWVRIIDNKKQFNVRYRQPHPEDGFAILVNEGTVFPLSPDAKEVQMPRWKYDTKRYPTADFIRRVIEYCYKE